MRSLIEILEAFTGYLDMAACMGVFNDDELEEIGKLEDELYVQIKDMEIVDED